VIKCSSKLEITMYLFGYSFPLCNAVSKRCKLGSYMLHLFTPAQQPLRLWTFLFHTSRVTFSFLSSNEILRVCRPTTSMLCSLTVLYILFGNRSSHAEYVESLAVPQRRLSRAPQPRLQHSRMHKYISHSLERRSNDVFCKQ
jgi:hypothetical protein